MPSTSTDSPTTSDAAARMPVDLRRLPGLRPLAIDYVHNFAALSSFFAGDPSDPSVWATAIARAQSRQVARPDLSAILIRQQRERSAPQPAMTAARRLAEAQTVAVVTGQQPGLMGGPLYTLFKAITALKLADAIERRHGVPAVAVFWIEAEDHDWDEIRGCTLLDEAAALRTLSLAAPSDDHPVPASSRVLDDSIGPLLDDIERTLPPTEFRQPLMADLREVYAPGVGVADAFGRWLERLLGPYGLVVYDASDPATKPLVRDVFARDLSTPGQTARLAAAAGAELVTCGYHAQVEPAAESTGLFTLDGGRRPIRLQGEGFEIDGRAVAASDLVTLARTDPARFSPNVLLRPIVQDTLFPTVSYVAGPNELAYLGQLRGVYDLYGVPMPLMFPRATATLVDAAALRFLRKSGIPFEALQRQDDTALNDLLAARFPPEVEAAFTDAANGIDASMARLAAAIPALDPTLEGAAHSTLGRMQHDMRTLHNKMIQTAKRRDDTLRRQFTRTRALAFPGGQPQERSVAFIAFLNQYGPSLPARLHEMLPLEPGQHWVLTV